MNVSKDVWLNQYVSQWFFDIQREYVPVLLEIGYQGAKSTHLFSSRNINSGGPDPLIPEVRRRVRPQWSSVSLRDDGANAISNQFLAIIKRPGDLDLFARTVGDIHEDEAANHAAKQAPRSVSQASWLKRTNLSRIRLAKCHARLGTTSRS